MPSEDTVRRMIGEPAGHPSSGRWRHFFGLVSGYFTSKDWPVAWTLLAIILAVTFSGVQGAVGLVNWQKTLFDAVGAGRYDLLWGIMLQFLLLTLWVVGFRVVSAYLQGILAIRWRTHLTQDYTRRYLANARVYDVERRGIADNPDQRIAEDINLFLSPPNGAAMGGGVLSLALNYLQAALFTFSYTKILWEKSQPIVVSLAGARLSIPGDFVIYTYGYALFSFVIVYYVAKPLIRRSMRMQKAEADFRFAMTNIRRAAEQIAFYRAAATEWRRLTERFGRVRNAFVQLLNARTGLDATQGALSSVNDVVPYLAALPRYFAGTMTLGDVQQSRFAFQSLQGALGLFIASYGQVASLVAIVNRLHLLDEEIAHAPEGDIAVTSGGATPAAATALKLTLPTGEPLVALDRWRVEPGQRWAIQGSSGAGKSTLLRAVAGLWPHGSGSVSLGGQRAMFVPQQLYTPDGTLRELLAFPGEADGFDDVAMRMALEAVRLPRLVALLDEYRSWGRELSPGEQQRIAFARILIHRPDVLFLDEATSALDPDNAAEMYALIGRALPDLTLVSIVHNPTLAALHDHHLDLADGRASIRAA